MVKIIKKIFAFCLIVFLFVICLYINNTPLNLEKIYLKSCIDGDTAIFTVDGNQTTIRFLAIDAPENDTELGKEVSNYVCKVLNDASNLSLEYEEGVTLDKYNRTLAWIYVDDKLLQEDLIEKGYAQVKYIYDDYKYVQLLENKQVIAKKQKIGIWK